MAFGVRCTNPHHPRVHRREQRKPTTAATMVSPCHNTTVRPFLLMMLLLLLLLAAAQPATASISFVDSGKTFASRQDAHIGQPLLTGYEYMGRLQYVPENPQLCPGRYNPHQRFKIVGPTDGVPVALVAKSGGCSLMDKVRVASALIDPSNTVGYLIVQERSKRQHLSLYSSDYSNNNNNESPNTEIEALDNPSQLEQFGNSVTNRLFDEDEDGESFYTSSLEQSTTDCDLESAERNGRALLELTKLESGPDINLAILHVSYGTGETLVDVLNVEDTLDRRKGGPRVLLNGRGNAWGTRTVVFWMLVVFSVCACGCACLLICVQTIEDEQQQDVPRRPVRRRLTLEEVRTRFPSCHFDDAAAAAARTTCGQDDGSGNSSSGAASCSSCMGGGGTNDQDECTICLDEFVHSDRIRKLPCGHVFHSTCIARWLIERNAVCPLCKLDLFIEEEDDSDSDSSNSNSNTNTNANTNSEGYTQLVVPFGSAESAEALVEESRSWWPFSLETVPSANDEEEEQVVRWPFATAATAISSFYTNTRNSTNTPGIGNLFGSWRRWYQHGHHSSTELTEPLVSLAAAVAEESAATATASRSD